MHIEAGFSISKQPPPLPKQPSPFAGHVARTTLCPLRFSCVARMMPVSGLLDRWTVNEHRGAACPDAVGCRSVLEAAIRRVRGPKPRTVPVDVASIRAIDVHRA